MSTPIVLTESLGKRYGAAPGHRALTDLNLAVEPGEIFGFLGPNGAGKSTTIRLLLGLLRPTEGRAAVLGLDAWKEASQIKREVGYLPGEVRFRERQTGRQILRLFSQLRGCLCDYDGLAERFGLDIDRSVRAYSKGMKQKLGLIQALMHDPKLIILDEPTSGLDPFSQRDVNDLLRERREAGATVFFSSHVLPEVEGLCDRVALLRGGELLRCAALDDLDELKIRRFEVAFVDAASAQAAAASMRDFCTHLSTVDSQVEGQTQSVAQLVRRLAGSDDVSAGVVLDSLRIERLRLEELFYQLYGEPAQQPDPLEGAAEPKGEVQ